MKTLKRLHIVTLALFAIAAFVQLNANSARADGGDSYSGYDSIVKELSSSTYSSQTSSSNQEIIRFHAGLGMLTSRLALQLPKGLPGTKTLRGYEARFGIDLFSPNWMAETAVRTYDPEPLADAEISMREFDMLVLYTAAIERPIYFNVGGGMSARYLDIAGGTLAGNFSRTNTTPASVFTAGLNAQVTPGFSVGAQFSYRNPIVRETIDKGSLDGSVRLAGRF